MVEVDRRGIARTAKKLGGEGTNVLLLRTSTPYEVSVLDAALPEDHGDSPANGGWSAGPKGWMLLVEGLDEQVDPWIEELARALTDAGVEGSLTGAPAVGPPRWAQVLSRDARWLSASIGFRTVGPGPHRGWAAGAAAREAVVAVGMRWLTAHGGDLMASTGQGANFWVDPATASAMFENDIIQGGSAVSGSYDRARQDIRHVNTKLPSAMTLTSKTSDLPWQQTVEELCAALLTAPLDLVSVGMIGYRQLGTYLASSPRTVAYDPRAYERHPERWDEFVLEPSGIQILTDRHLAHAHDLSGWSTTRLDGDHVLVEAHDLEPWYATPLRQHESPDPELLEHARRDFGDMILTPERAQQLGL